jgi:hypothetical protein
MKAKEQVFVKYEDESGQKYYCTINVVANKDNVSEWDLDNCVEASDKKRYSENLDIVDRSK